MNIHARSWEVQAWENLESELNWGDFHWNWDNFLCNWDNLFGIGVISIGIGIVPLELGGGKGLGMDVPGIFRDCPPPGIPRNAWGWEFGSPSCSGVFQGVRAGYGFQGSPTG